jgi:hypothetical protein
VQEGICDEVTRLTYRPEGKGYELVEARRVAADCNLWTEGRKRAVTIEVVPTSRQEWAVAFEETSEGVSVSKISLDHQLWGQLGLRGSHPNRTPSQCVQMAKEAAVTRRSVPISKEEAERLLGELGKIDLRGDRCPRDAAGRCAYILDGTSYYVQLPHRPAVRLTEVGHSSDHRSENPKLSDWVLDVLEAARANQ